MPLRKTKITLLCILIFGCLLFGENYDKSNYQTISSTNDHTTYLDANNLLCFIYNDGNFAYDMANYLGRTNGLYFPRGTDKTVMYAAGIWMGAKVNGEIRTVVASYSSEFTYGPMENGTYLPDNPEFKVYKIDRTASGSDYDNWPANQGAPVDEYGNPLLLGDQMCWAVFNDADTSKHENTAGHCDPLGLEVQQTSFVFDRLGALDNTIFLKFLIINKGGNTLTDAYVSLWADPDVGGSNDDLVGCDTLLSLGYAYNDNGTDSDYGDSPPAVGFAIYQGPVVDGAPDDSARFMGQWIYGKRNLPMTSFNKYTNGTDPHSNIETYNYMQGLTLDGDLWIDPNSGDITTFVHAGDPVAGTGWLDGASSDRRFMMSAGPFNMNPGDTQEVIAAIIVGQGNDRLESVANLKSNAEDMQFIYDIDFNVPNPPLWFQVFARPLDGAVDLIWSSGMENHYQDYLDALGQFYVFEGYNVYQGDSQHGPWHKIATFDMTAEESQRTFEDVAGEFVIDCYGEPGDIVCDSTPRPWNFELIYHWVFDGGAPELKVSQNGDDTGIQNIFHIDQDHVNGGPILNDVPYYFAVTTYEVNIENVRSEDSVFIGENFLGFLAANLERDPDPIEVIPRADQSALQTDTAEHIAGSSNGVVIIEYLDQTQLQAGDYEVTFNSDNTWNLYRDDILLLYNQDQQESGYGFPVIDGIMIRVLTQGSGIAPAVDNENGGVIEISNEYGPVEPPDNVFWSLNSTDDFYVSSDISGASDEARARFNWRGNINNESWEFRFTASGSQFYNWDTDELFGGRIPFEVWHFSGNDTEPDRRDNIAILDDDESGNWNWGDRIYIIETEYSEPLPQTAQYNFDDDFHLGRILFNDYSGLLDEPAEGTIIRFNSTRPNTASDVFTFTVAEALCGDANSDGVVNVSDAIFLVNYIFIGGPEPQPLEMSNTNCDTKVNLADIIYIINYVFKGGPAPCDCE